jgi:hypothetical protein
MKRLVVGFLGLWLWACSGDAALTPQEFEHQVDEVWCQKYAECSGRAPVESCRERLGLKDERVRFPWEADQVTSGRVIFHADRAAQCVDAIEKASCAAAVGFEWVNWADPVCLTVYEPAQGENQPCDYDFNGRLARECKGRMACEIDPSCDPSSTCCQGTCSTRSGELPEVLAGEGAACQGDIECQSQLVCGPAGKCMVPRNAGDPCWGYCAGDNVCRDGTCQAPDVRDGVTTCTGGTGTTSVCDADHYCGTDGHCWPFKKEGDACGPGVGVCDWFYGCPYDTHVCTLRRDRGESCRSADDCQAWHGRCLDGKCAPALADGEACTLDTQCVSNHCAAGACAPLSVCDVSRL